MDKIGQRERATQLRVIGLLQSVMGYAYYGDWTDRGENSNIEVRYLGSYLQRRGYSVGVWTKAIDELKRVADTHSKTLYDKNKEVYGLLRYGIPVRESVDAEYVTVQVIDWANWANNDWGVAEEVTIRGNREKRPDVVVYVNGIALAVLELKRGLVDVAEGIRQSITNQQVGFIESFFATVQLVMAGNDTQGLRYGTIGTPEKYYLNWKEDEAEQSGYKLDKYLQKMCNKERLLDLLYNCVLFESGSKKLPRPHQYFALKAAQVRIGQREGGVIWHTQGSGKSILMILLAKWLLENNAKARVIILTDRTELDKQIEGVFRDAGMEVKRTQSGGELMAQLCQPMPRLLCSLVHKFGHRGGDDGFNDFIRQAKERPLPTVGELFVFVDECHRTQSGRLHSAMKAVLQDAIFIGFTGTPLLKSDKQTTELVFGTKIHTYKFGEAVADGVVKDLVYEGRDIDQSLSSHERIDAWFEAKTRGLNEFQKKALKQKWVTMQHVLSSRSRMERLVSDVVFDFSTKPRLSSERGNAMLVANSILDACKYFELFNRTDLKGKCAVITSYNPSTRDINTEDTGANTESDKEYIYNTYEGLLKDLAANPNQSKTETYEDKAKDKFRKEPAQMKLLIVVSKLLTGFDAPACTYLYIDKAMQDHTLFQAICRVNRLDTDDKAYGYIVDYKNLFSNVTDAIRVYTAALAESGGSVADNEIMMCSRLKQERERLDATLEALEVLCEAVLPPKGQLDYFAYFCGNTEVESDLREREPQRTALYKATVAFIRAYANMSADMVEAGYNEQEIKHIEARLDFYLKLREEIRKLSGEVLDLKAYESDMRHLLDNYIQASDAVVVSPFGDMPLLEIIDSYGLEEAIGSMPEDIKSNEPAVAETIENNVRQKIMRDHLIDPAFFEDMSKLLDAIIKERKNNALDYAAYLQKISDLAKQVQQGKQTAVPISLKTGALVALYNNLGQNEALAIACDKAVRYVKQDNFRGDLMKERKIKAALHKELGNDAEVERIFKIVMSQKDY
jgi:type I restriction enzyme, R subunit